MSANAVAFGMSGLILPLFVWFIAITTEYDLNSAELKGIASVEFAAFITLLFTAIWHTAITPFGEVISLIFTAIPLLYGLLWLIASIIHWFDVDMKPLGITALLLIPIQILLILALFAAQAPVSWGIIIDLLIYAPFTLLGFYLFTHGYMMPTSKRYTGWMCLISSIATAHLLFIGSGIVGPIFPLI